MSRRKTDIQFKKEVYDLVGNEYTFLDTYVNARSNIKIRHNECGTIYMVTPDHFLHGSRCPYCAGLIKKTDEQFKKEVFSLVGNEYTFLDSYVNAKTKLRIKHNKCGNIYKEKPNAFFNGGRCPYCNMPKTEKMIAKILNMFNIKYEIQKTFDDLKDIQLLSYDFFIPSQSTLIEYQGQQHYQSVNLYGGEAQFEYQQKHDKMKADYAKEHGYNLIAVPYTEDTFSKIQKYLLGHGLSK